MIKIIDDRDLEIQECPTKLPFFTMIEDELYLYYEEGCENVSCVCVTNGTKQVGEFDNIRDAFTKFNAGEKIVEVELHIVK
jgi:hypothetical protein